MNEKEILFDHSRLTTLMDKGGLDLILASRRQNVAYLSGMTEIIYWEYPNVTHILEIQEDGCESADYFVGIAKNDSITPFAVVHQSRVYSWQNSWISDVQPWCNGLKLKATDMIVESITKRGLTEATIGIEMNHIPSNHLAELKERLPKVKFKVADTIFWKMRMVKTKTELFRQRKAYEIAENIYTELMKELHDGMTVSKVRELEMAVAIKFNCPPLHFGYVKPVYNPYGGIVSPYFNYQDNTEVHNQTRLRQGDLILSDIGLVFCGYTTDFGRMISIGKADAKTKNAYQIILEARKVLEDAVRPGRKISEVYTSGAKYLAEHGIHNIPYLGHSIGMECHELPSIVEHDHTVIEGGMTLVLELCPEVDGIWFLLENAGVVTGDGWQSLTELTVDIMETGTQ
ncbi:MAG: aminopeptidase P family protein [Planctomycetes bacterium]|nr:aminopeptidase P family protein [Planctomycetota bacterium]